MHDALQQFGHQTQQRDWSVVGSSGATSRLMKGVTVESFQSAGRWPEVSDALNSEVRAGEIAEAVFLSMVLERPLGPGGVQFEGREQCINFRF